MMAWTDQLKANPLAWLLEPDAVNPGVRYFALRDLLSRPADDPEVVVAQAEVMKTGPVPVILNAQAEEGYWVKPGPGYSPKYQSTLWSLLFLAQLGADGRDERVRRAVEYVFDHAQTEAGAFSCSGTPSAAYHCLWGNVVRAMLDLGVWGDERLTQAIDWLARSVIGDGYGAYVKSAVQAPGFACAINDGLPCGWGAVRVLWALNAVPAEGRTPAVQAAVRSSIDFLLSYDIARAEYPYSSRISPHWFEFAYPLGYVTDILLDLEALTEAGVVDNSRLNDAVTWMLSKQDEQGRWKLEYSYRSRMWINIERMNKPSKWVTLRALRVLKRMGVELAEN
jgi:hypothetical protein